MQLDLPTLPKIWRHIWMLPMRGILYLIILLNSKFVISFLFQGFFSSKHKRLYIFLVKTQEIIQSTYIKHQVSTYLLDVSTNVIIHCYHVNDCSSKTLVIKGGVHFLRHCWPFITDLNFANKRRMAFFFSTKMLTSF